MLILALEVVDRAGDGECVVGYEVYAKTSGGRGKGRRGDALREVGVELGCAVGFAGGGVAG